MPPAVFVSGRSGMTSTRLPVGFRLLADIPACTTTAARRPRGATGERRAATCSLACGATRLREG
jgi:hypothetical protein